MGPAERALGSALASLLGTPGNPTQGEILLEPTTKPVVGDFRFDLRPFLGAAAEEKARCQDLARLVSGLEGVEKATAIPPRIYIKVESAFLHGHVVPAILRDPGTYGSEEAGKGLTAIVTFSDPNANKPLHLGHLRNNFIGMALAGLLSAQEYSVERHATLSDWGIHICQALLAYMKWGAGATPEDAGVKGDHFLGRYYVMFHNENQKQKPLPSGDSSDYPAGQTESAPTKLEAEAAALLRRMQEGEDALLRLNRRLTEWAEAGIGETYARIGTRFDAVFRELDTLPVAERVIEAALAGGLCHRRGDGSVFVDLGKDGLGEVTLIRKDSTPVVYTQMMGIDVLRFERRLDKVLSIFGREWETGATGYVEVLRRFGYEWVPKYEPVYYGMVRLPEGRMKSREGKIVSADELIDQMRDRLATQPGSWGANLPETEPETLAVGLLKYYFLRVRRTEDLLYDERRLWERALPAFAAIVEAAAPRAEAPMREPMLPPSEPLRLLLLHLNAFPRALRRALEAREPAEVVRFLEELSLKLKACRSQGTPPEVIKAAAIVTRRGLSVLNIDLPLLHESLNPRRPEATVSP